MTPKRLHHEFCRKCGWWRNRGATGGVPIFGNELLRAMQGERNRMSSDQVQGKEARAHYRGGFRSGGFGYEYKIYDRHGEFLATATNEGSAAVIVAALNEVYGK